MKLRKKKKNVKGLIFKLLIAIIVILSVAGIIYYFLTVEDEDNNLTLLEKQWVESNKSVLVDINVPNNTYIYAKEGDGVIFDFLDYVTESVGLSFNKMPYNYTSSVNYDGLSIALLKPTDAILDNDLEEIKKELGDILLHMVFYAKIASEQKPKIIFLSYL